MLKSSFLIKAVDVIMRRRLMDAIILVAACSIGITAALTGLGRPIESLFQSVRQSTLMHDASGEVVIVAIDGQSMDEIAHWPWPRGIHGQMVDRLVDAGAKRIAFDISFTNPAADVEQDRLFAAAIERSKGRVILPGVVTDPAPHKGQMEEITSMPTPELARHALVSSIYIWLDADFYARSLPYSKVIGGRHRMSTAALLAERNGPLDQSFPLDWSINPDSIPTYSYSDVLSGKIPASSFAGKLVLVGATAETLGDRYTVPNYGRIPGIYIQAVGAETLLRYVPVDVGPWPVLAIFGAILIAAVASGRPSLQWSAIALSTINVVMLPYALDALSPVSVAIVPALFMIIGMLTMQSLYAGLRAIITYLTQSSASRLPNMLAMSLEENNAGVTVVVRMRNYVETTALLGVSARGELMRKMHHRLEMANDGEAIFQTDEHSFSWRSDKTVEEIADSIEGMYALFSPGISIGDLTVDATIAIGICDDPSLGIEDAVVAATLAADRAAQRGLRWERYESEREDANWKLSILSELDAAIDNGNVWVAYQPKYDIETNQVSGAEALVRWTHPERGFIAPDRFIPIVEEANRIEKLTLFVLRSAIRDFAEMPGSLSVAVNISARLLGQNRLVEPVKNMLSEYGLPASSLTLEITESAAMAGDSGVDELTRLRELGIAISIDDYGTGQSTLSYLKRLPATELKIDRSFVQNVQTSRSDATVVDSTIKLAHALGMKVVAEGVENQEILEALAAMECDVIQGYHISRPVALPEFLALPIIQKVIGSTKRSEAA